jgi:ornithine--oxo-acid transaminase
MPDLIRKALAERAGEKLSLHEAHLNKQMVRVLRTIGFNRDYRRGQGAYLFDDEGHRYLDLLSGWGVFARGRNHPVINGALQEVLSARLPNLVQMDVSLLSGLLAEALVKPPQELAWSACSSPIPALKPLKQRSSWPATRRDAKALSIASTHFTA